MRFGGIDHFILFGGGPLLCEVAVDLRDRGFEVLVVTSERHAQENLPQGNSLEGRLCQKGIEVIISADVNTDASVLGRIGPHTMGLSMGAAWIFKPRFIQLFGNRLLNLHGTRLPQDRGGGGFSWRILRADRTGMSLIHQVAPGVDTGPIVACEEYVFPASCRLPIHYQHHALERYKTLLDRFLQEVAEDKEFELAGQPEYLSTYWPRLSAGVHGYIDWSWNLRDLELFICAFDDPYAGAMTFVNGRPVRLKQCYATLSDGVFHPFQKGIVYRIGKDAVHVATEQGSLVVCRVLAHDGGEAAAKLSVGDRFFTPAQYLEQAKQYRAVYTPRGLQQSRSS
jgi:methionyl-tRNA formyltransferase